MSARSRTALAQTPLLTCSGRQRRRSGYPIENYHAPGRMHAAHRIYGLGGCMPGVER
jgi:hypothetical protein